MGELLWLGAALGALLGVLHGVYLYRSLVERAPAGDAPHSRAVALYHGLWAFILWTLFGAYVLAFWVLGMLVYAAVSVAKSVRAAG